jgi:hypothetical protein
MFSKSVKFLRPKLAIARDPLVQLTQVIGTKHVDALLCARTHFNETGFTKDPKVSRNSRLRQTRKRFDQVASWQFPFGQQIQHRAPRRVRDGRENVHLSATLSCPR